MRDHILREMAACLAYDGPDGIGALWGLADWAVEADLRGMDPHAMLAAAQDSLDRG